MLVRSVGTVVVVGALGLFGYYFFTDASGKSGMEKAKDAAAHVGDKMRDEGVSGLVKARLVTLFGIDNASFLHVYFNDGKALVYGLLADGIKPEQLTAAALQVPGVKAAEVLTQPRPASLGGAAPTNP